MGPFRSKKTKTALPGAPRPMQPMKMPGSKMPGMSGLPDPAGFAQGGAPRPALPQYQAGGAREIRPPVYDENDMPIPDGALDRPTKGTPDPQWPFFDPYKAAGAALEVLPVSRGVRMPTGEIIQGAKKTMEVLPPALAKVGAGAAGLGSYLFGTDAAQAPEDPRMVEIRDLQAKIDANAAKAVDLGKQKYRGTPEEANASRKLALEALAAQSAPWQARIDQLRAQIERGSAGKISEAADARQKILNEAPKPFAKEYEGLSKNWQWMPAAAAGATALAMRVPNIAGDWIKKRGWDRAVNRGEATTSSQVRDRMANTAEAYAGQTPPKGFFNVKDYLPPAIVGMAEGAFGIHTPQRYNQQQLPIENPEYAAMQKYIELLPEGQDGDAERVRANKLLANIPQKHPDRKAADEYFEDKTGLAVKGAIGAGSSLPGAFMGTTAGKLFQVPEGAWPRARTAALVKERDAAAQAAAEEAEAARRAEQSRLLPPPPISALEGQGGGTSGTPTAGLLPPPPVRALPGPETPPPAEGTKPATGATPEAPTGSTGATPPAGGGGGGGGSSASSTPAADPRGKPPRGYAWASDNPENRQLRKKGLFSKLHKARKSQDPKQGEQAANDAATESLDPNSRLTKGQADGGEVLPRYAIGGPSPEQPPGGVLGKFVRKMRGPGPGSKMSQPVPATEPMLPAYSTGGSTGDDGLLEHLFGRLMSATPPQTPSPSSNGFEDPGFGTFPHLWNSVRGQPQPTTQQPGVGPNGFDLSQMSAASGGAMLPRFAKGGNTVAGYLQEREKAHTQEGLGGAPKGMPARHNHLDQAEQAGAGARAFQGLDMPEAPMREELDRAYGQGWRPGSQAPGGPMGGRREDEFRPFARGGDAGDPPPDNSPPIGGAVEGRTPGRGDHLPVNVTSGSYVIPAYAVAALGDDNTAHGMARLNQAFPPHEHQTLAAGGHAGPSVPIKISDGEFVVTPDNVTKLGGGDLQKGHRVLDAMVEQVRQAQMKKLKEMPPPAKG